MGRLFALLICWLLFIPVAQSESAKTLLMPGQVIQGHAKYEDNCGYCHKSFDKHGQDRLCLDCHKDIAADIGGKSRLHGRNEPDKPCRDCHLEHKGRLADIVHLDARHFDHKRTDFDLHGKHADLECAKCHAKGVKYRKAPRDCWSCHKNDDNKAHKGGLGRKCQDCHVETDWKKVGFDHGKTRYPLLGKHREAKCTGCHSNDQFRKTPRDCYSCHKQDNVKAHKGRLGKKCESCHTEQDWKRVNYDHDRLTRYPLRGRHREVRCSGCHKPGEDYRGTSTRCLACHEKDDARTHRANLGQLCEGCHTEKSWKEIVGFDHQKTKYPLKDKHAKVECDKCHASLLYKDTRSDCWSCHQKDDARTHRANLGQLCEDCHTEKSWKEIVGFDHQKTKYPLKDKHARVECNKCHATLLYKDTQSDCWSCHKAADDKTHKGRYGEKCESCHTEADWKQIRFNHDRDTRWPLKGGHLKPRCDACHTGLLKDKLKTDCWSCHQKDDARTHRANLGQLCEGCHTENRWKEIVGFDHQKTKYPLKDKHARVECNKCHATLLYKDTRPDCWSCHKAADDKTHKGNLGRRCESCHSEQDWKTIHGFDHTRTRYPLLGRHARVECGKCHASLLYKDTPGDCLSCHRKDEEKAHPGRYGQKCEACHNVRDWKVWDFDHNRRTRYRLDGAHRKVACRDCHTRPLDTRIPLHTDCRSCHERRDVHDGGFGRDCERCHGTTSWKDLTGTDWQR